MTAQQALQIVRDCADRLAAEWYDCEAYELREAADCLEGVLPCFDEADHPDPEKEPG